MSDFLSAFGKAFVSEFGKAAVAGAICGLVAVAAATAVDSSKKKEESK